MTAYLLTCECGKNVPVEIGQAGGRITCTCGAQLDVPPLRKLRDLPIAAPEAARSSAAWNARKGVIAACLIAATMLACVALWSRLSEPTVPRFDPRTHQRFVDQGIDAITPAQAWQRWIEVYTPLAEQGFSEFTDPRAAVIEQQIAERRFLQWILLILAGVCAAVALAAALWPSRRRSPLDKRE